MKKGVSEYTHTKEQLDHYANQHNPNNEAYKAAMDNHSNQCNPNNPNYHSDDECMSKEDGYELLRSIGVPFGPDGEPLGIGDGY